MISSKKIPKAQLDLDDLIAEQVTQNTAIALNTAKTTNATHTGDVTGATTLTIESTAISTKTAKTTLAGTEEILINDAGTLKKTTAQSIANLAPIPVTIIDSVPSLPVSSITDVLIKTYDVGSLSGSKKLYVEHLFHKSTVATGTINAQVYLKEKTSSTSFLLGTLATTTANQYGPINKLISIDQASTIIRVPSPTTGGFSTYLAATNGNITEYTINFAKEYEVQVFLRVSDIAVAARQYYAEIIKE